MRMEAMALMLAGRFEEALELMEPRKDSANYKDYSMLLDSHQQLFKHNRTVSIVSLERPALQ